jgi:hypothetical protein
MWSGKLCVYQKLIVPLQIDLAIEVRRYVVDRSANPGRPTTDDADTASRGYRLPVSDRICTSFGFSRDQVGRRGHGVAG